MSYNESLAERMRPLFLPRTGASEKTMFGGIGFFVYGNMCCGIWNDFLVIRLSKEEGAAASTEKYAKVMDLTGKPMRGWVMVEPAGMEKDADLIRWIEKAYMFASSLPKK
jgi:TfoX/Sxy family transcriptional regulator of competence genes